MQNPYIPVGIMLVGSCLFTALLMGLSALLRSSRPTREKLAPYECGVDPVPQPQGRLSIHFYVLALIFIVFDVETVFLYPWAVLFQKLGWLGFVEMLGFLFILSFGLVYAWRKGALSWQ